MARFGPLGVILAFAGSRRQPLPGLGRPRGGRCQRPQLPLDSADVGRIRHDAPALESHGEGRILAF
jgi:hypothetical protein